MVALTFIGLPFVVRTLEPVLQDLDPEFEEAAATLGAGRLQTFLRVVFPAILPALLTGVALAFARGVGEYGSVIFIAGNMPMISEIAPLLIVVKLEQYDYAGAAAVGVAMLLISFLLLLLINLLQRWKTAQGSYLSHGRFNLMAHARRGGQRARPGQMGVCSRWPWSISALFLVLPLASVYRRGAGRRLRPFLRGDPGSRRAGRRAADAAGGGDRRAAQPRLRPGRGLDHRQVRLPRQEPPDHPDRSALLRLAGGLGPDLCPDVRGPGLARPLAPGP